MRLGWIYELRPKRCLEKGPEDLRPVSMERAAMDSCGPSQHPRQRALAASVRTYLQPAQSIELASSLGSLKRKGVKT